MQNNNNISSDLEDLESKLLFANRDSVIKNYIYSYISFNKEDVYKKNIKEIIDLKETSDDDIYMNLSDCSYKELDKFMRNLFKY